TSTRRRWATSSCGWPSASASCCALTIASVARWVNRSVRIRSVHPLPGARLRRSRQEGGELVASLVVEPWQDNLRRHHQVASLLRAALRQATAREPDLLPVLRVRPDAQPDAAGRRRNRDLGPADRLGQGDGDLRSKLGPVA